MVHDVLLTLSVCLEVCGEFQNGPVYIYLDSNGQRINLNSKRPPASEIVEICLDHNDLFLSVFIDNRVHAKFMVTVDELGVNLDWVQGEELEVFLINL